MKLGILLRIDVPIGVDVTGSEVDCGLTVKFVLSGLTFGGFGLWFFLPLSTQLLDVVEVGLID